MTPSPIQVILFDLGGVLVEFDGIAPLIALSGNKLDKEGARRFWLTATCFAVANLARHLKVDPEKALRTANAKFVRRFRSIEAGLAKVGMSSAEATLDEMEALWQEAKKSE